MEKRLTDIVDEIVKRFNEHYGRNLTREELEPVIRYQWEVIRETLTSQKQYTYVKLPGFGVFKLRPIVAYRRFHKLKKYLVGLGKNHGNKTKINNEMSRCKALIKKYLKVRKEKNKHYEKYYIKHKDANPITYKFEENEPKKNMGQP